MRRTNRNLKSLSDRYTAFCQAVLPCRAGGELEHIGDIMRRTPGLAISKVVQRRVLAAEQIADGGDDREIAYHHAVFCQTVLPCRRVKDRVWKSTNGLVSLSIEAGTDLPLPFGPKARLILTGLDTPAVLHQSALVALGSVTSFIAKMQGRNPNGAELRKFQEQFAAIAGAQFHLSASQGDDPLRIDGKIITGFEPCYPNDERQRVRFPSSVRLSDDYFSSLCEHAVPLDPRAIHALENNALMLDIYKWLAQCLRRVPREHPAFLVWPNVMELFDPRYNRLRDFRKAFQKALKVVLSQYRDAQVEANVQGVRLCYSRPPILPKG